MWDFLAKYTFEELVVLGIITFCIYLIRFLIKRLSQVGYKDKADIHILLEDAITKLNADRIMVMQSSNGGGIPDIRGNIYITALYEAYTGKLRPVKHLIQNFSYIDQAYANILYLLAYAKKFRSYVVDLPDGITRRAFEDKDINFVEYHRISMGKRMYYLVIQYSNYRGHNKEDEMVIINLVEKLSTMFKHPSIIKILKNKMSKHE